MPPSPPTIGEKGTEDVQVIAPACARHDDDDDNGYRNDNDGCSIIVSSSVNREKTPYQIFLEGRCNNVSTTAFEKPDTWNGDIVDDERKETEEEEGRDDGIIIAPRVDIDALEDTITEGADDDDTDDVPSTSNTPRRRDRELSNDEDDGNTPHGVLSPNSVMIRQNARRLLEEKRPSWKKKVGNGTSREGRRGAQSSPMNNIRAPDEVSVAQINTGGDSIGSISGKNFKYAELNILEELEADFEEEEMRTSFSILRQTNEDATAAGRQKEDIVREDKTTEIGKVQEELQRVRRSLRNMKRLQETLARQNEDKENTIFKLRKDLQTKREQHDKNRIGRQRSRASKSRIPAPTRGAHGLKDTTNRQQGTLAQSAKPTGLVKPSAAACNSRKRKTTADSGGNDKENSNKKYKQIGTIDILGDMADNTKGNGPNNNNNGGRIRSRIVKLYREHDPSQIVKVDTVMARYEGREGVLLEKMIARYEGKGGKKNASKITRNNITAGSSTVEAKDSATSSILGGKPRTRQDMALERHMARMKRMKGVNGKTNLIFGEPQKLPPVK